jgi:hypothetical protein
VGSFTSSQAINWWLSSREIIKIDSVNSPPAAVSQISRPEMQYGRRQVHNAAGQKSGRDRWRMSAHIINSSAIKSNNRNQIKLILMTAAFLNGAR